MKILKFLVIRVLSLFIFVPSLFAFLFSIARNIPSILSHRGSIVFMGEGGFGHTVMDTQWIRLSRIPNPLFLILSEHNRHNWPLASIWPDVKVIHLVKTYPFTTFEIQHIMQYLGSYSIRLIASLKRSDYFEVLSQYNCANPNIKKLENQLTAYASSVDFDFTSVLNPPEDFTLHSSERFRNYCAGLFLFNNKPVDLNLSNATVNRYRSIKRPSTDTRPFVALYLRQKGRDERCGSSPKDWVEAIEYIQSSGYSILLVGDLSKSDFPERLWNSLFSADDFSLSEHDFYIFSLVNAAYFVGEQGGGSFLPIYLGIPSLLVNVTNLSGFCYPNVLLLPKPHFTYENLPIKVTQLLSSTSPFFWKTRSNSAYLHTKPNSSFQLTSAVTELLSVRMRDWSAYVKDSSASSAFEKGSLLSFCQARLAKSAYSY